MAGVSVPVPVSVVTRANGEDALGGPQVREGHRPRGFGYHPGLDGVRAIALLAVLAFHQGSAQARGGYLGVSAFFTLSGFLIATLALDERARTGRLSWVGFWERRARRLLPAALVTLAAVVVLQAHWGIGAGPRFRPDMLAAVGYVTNWRLAASGSDYGALFAAPSPLIHLWSLAIEEQFYLLFPLAFAGLVALVGGRRRWGAAVVGAAALGSFALAWWSSARMGNDGLTYYSTHTRAGELLVGVALAFVLGSARGHRALGSRPARRVLTALGLASLVALAWLWHDVAIGDPHLFRGVTGLNALLTAVVITAILAGPVDRLLGVAPLRGLGKISYAGYLYHWPLFLLIAAPRVRLTGVPLFGVRLAATVAAATVSYYLIESPFRFRLRMPRPRLAAVMTTGVAVVVALVALAPAARLPAAPGGGVSSLNSSSVSEAGGAAAFGSGPVEGIRTVRAIVPPGGRPATDTVFLAGDSVAWSLMLGFVGWNASGTDRPIRLDTHIAFGCPVGGPGLVRDIREHDTLEDCDTWRDDLPGALARSQPDAVVIVMGLEDLGGRRIDGRWRTLGDPVHDRWLRGQIDKVASLLERPGVPVVWLTFPHIRLRDVSDPTRPWQDIAINDPDKVTRLNSLIRRAVADHPAITVVDLAAWLKTWPGQSFRPADRDGVHFRYDAAIRVDAWLLPQVLAGVDRATAAP